LVLPGDRPLPIREVVSGLYVVEQTHERDLGFFSESPLYAKECGGPEAPRSDGAAQDQPQSVVG
jgi:hypothetical protein